MVFFYNWRTSGPPLKILNAKFKTDEKNTIFSPQMNEIVEFIVRRCCEAKKEKSI